MIHDALQVLTPAQADHFVEKGYVVVKGCFSRAFAQQWIDEAYVRFIIMHPYMLHASSNNHAGKARFMTNPPVVLKDPLDLNRSNPADFSLLERATLHALGVERYDFQPTGPRAERWTVISD